MAASSPTHSDSSDKKQKLDRDELLSAISRNLISDPEVYNGLLDVFTLLSTISWDLISDRAR